MIYRSFRQLFLLLSAFFVITNIAIAASSKQMVYLAEEPLPKIVERLLASGISPKDVVPFLKKTLTKITPELAKSKFGVNWIDNDPNLKAYAGQIELYGNNMGLIAAEMDKNSAVAAPEQPIKWKNTYPDLVISYIGPEVGYGLFALDYIPAGTIVAEYAGKHIKNENDESKGSAYVFDVSGAGFEMNPGCKPDFEAIDAEHDGNSSRFALHLLSKSSLDLYGYRDADKNLLSDTKKIAIANVVQLPVCNGSDLHIVLFAANNIHPFEQIGFEYDPAFGFGFPNQSPGWRDEPYLFDKSGNIISPQDQRLDNVGIAILDSCTDMYYIFYESVYKLKLGLFDDDQEIFRRQLLKLDNKRSEKIEGLEIDHNIVDQYLIIKHRGGRLVVDLDTFKNKFRNTTRHRITVPGYAIDKNTDLQGFIRVLEEMKKYKISIENHNKIVKQAIYGQNAKVERLLAEVKANQASAEQDL